MLGVIFIFNIQIRLSTNMVYRHNLEYNALVKTFTANVPLLIAKF